MFSSGPGAKLSLPQQAFVAEFLANGHNATKAYRVAYNPPATLTDREVSKKAHEVKSSPNVLKVIEDTMHRVANPVVFDQQAALKAWLDIATANPNELISLRVGCCRYCYGEGGKYQWRQREYEEALDRYDGQVQVLTGKARAELKLPDPAGGFGFDATRPPRQGCEECHGEGVERVVPRDTTKLTPEALLLYGGVKQTRDGVQIIIADRLKALENACRIIGAFDDKLKLNGTLATMHAAIQLNTTDPNEAAKLYQQMVGEIAAS